MKHRGRRLRAWVRGWLDGAAEPGGGEAGERLRGPAPLVASPSVEVAPVEVGHAAFVSGAAVATLRRAGPRPKLIHHWASWCAPCELELPELVGWLELHGGRFEVHAVSWELFEAGPAGGEGALDLVLGHAGRHGLVARHHVVQGEPERFFAQAGLQARTIPQTEVVWPDGRRFHRAGMLDPGDYRALERWPEG